VKIAVEGKLCILCALKVKDISEKKGRILVQGTGYISFASNKVEESWRFADRDKHRIVRRRFRNRANAS